MAEYLFQPKLDGIEKLTYILVDKLKVKINATSVKDSIKSHPYYPSLLSISDVLKNWNIDTLALRISPSQLREIPIPFIAHLRHTFVLVTEYADDWISYIDERNKTTKSSIESFAELWDGSVLAVEATSNSGEESYTKNRIKIRFEAIKIPLSIAFLVTLGLFEIVTKSEIFNLNSKNSIYVILSLINIIIGIGITGILLWYEYDDSNLNLNSICSIGSKTNCEAVLTSKGSKIFGVISWAEVGFNYFVGFFAYLCFTTRADFINTIAFLNLVTLPYIIYSIFYQGLIVKQWCVLCILIQFLFFSQFLNSLFSGVKISDIIFLAKVDIVGILITFCVTSLFWLLIRPFLQAVRDGRNLIYDLKKFKNHPEVFRALLQEQSSMVNNIDKIGINIGNHFANNVLVKVCNPYCDPCAKAHESVEKLIRNNKNWKVKIIFTSSPDESDVSNRPVLHFLQASKDLESKKLDLMLHDWYSSKNYADFAKKYPLHENIRTLREEVALMSSWCKKEHIVSTPTLFVNGYKIPAHYGIEDLVSIDE